MVLIADVQQLAEQSTHAPDPNRLPDSMDGAPKSRQQSPRTFLARSLIDIAVLGRANPGTDCQVWEPQRLYDCGVAPGTRRHKLQLECAYRARPRR